MKIGKNKQSVFQKQAQEEIERAGGIYKIVRNLDDLDDIIGSG